jgi:hypothetical protein
MSDFNPEAFMQVEHDADFDTAPVPTAEGQWNDPLCTSATVRQNERKDGSGSFISLDMMWSIQDPDLQSEMGYEGDRHPACRQSIILDTDENGMMTSGPGENWRLGQVFAACGMDKPYILANLKGAMAGSCLVRQELNPKSDQMVANIASISGERKEA